MLGLVCLSGSSIAQSKTASETLHELKKLQNPMRVLYLAAHPDDENTRMISWLANGVGANTAYLSLTRGDGGQNLIGTELGAKLGVLRTQELMQARNIDGGQQFFTRAVDFGYSKNADETFDKWQEQEVLADVVWVIRKFRPDVIVTRFPPDKRAGHGHHTASAMLGIKAFEWAADASKYPEQLKEVSVWQAERIYWNASVWWNKELPKLAAEDPNYVAVEVGGYNGLMGTSYNEWASKSRTQHKSQGFGVSVARGQNAEYLKHLAGSKAKESLFENVPQTWERYDFAEGDKMLAQIVNDFQIINPAASVKGLIALKKAAQKINNPAEKTYFTEKVNELILACLGFHAELLAPGPYITHNAPVALNLEVLCRAQELPVKLQAIAIGGQAQSLEETLKTNQIFKTELDYIVQEELSQPYWLIGDYQNMFSVNNSRLLGTPENEAAVKVRITLTADGESFEHVIPLTYKYSDRVEGEIIEPVYVMPNFTVTSNKSNLIFVDDQAQELELEVRHFATGEKTIQLSAEGWQVTPEKLSVKGASGSSQLVTVTVKPKKGSALQKLHFSSGDKALYGLTEIAYKHIEKRLVFESSDVQLTPIDLKIVGKKVGYINGAGDKVAAAIEQMGYEVDVLDEAAIRNTDLSQYQCIIAGIRAYNTEKWLPNVKEVLMNYVEGGGHYLVQYNTASRDLLSLDIGPYPFKIGRDRVTDENSEVKFLDKKHAVFNSPNSLTKADFDNWVQERGLYFSTEWDKKFTPLFGWNDKGESEKKGALIMAPYGSGTFSYCGISFFRELPAGVPGAYRLLANLISYQPTSNP